MRQILVDYARKHHGPPSAGVANLTLTLDEAYRASKQGKLDLVALDDA